MTSELDKLEDFYTRQVDDKREVLLINPHQSEASKDDLGGGAGTASEMSGTLDDSRKKVAQSSKHKILSVIAPQYR